jgi:hypothetical protein
MMFKLWNTGILASYLWKMNGYGVMSRRQHPGIPSCTSAGCVLQLCKVSQKFNKQFSRSCAYKVHAPPFRESISWIISLFKFWTATIFLRAHLQVVYYKCVKFHKNPISRLGGVALTRYMDRRTHSHEKMVWREGILFFYNRHPYNFALFHPF